MSEFSSKEELQKKYATLSDAQILDVLANKSNYTNIAFDVAFEELKKRNISEQETEQYIHIVQEERKQTIENKQLHLIGKILYFVLAFSFIGIFAAFLNKEDYEKRGSVHKSRQILYYSVFGIVFYTFLKAYAVFCGGVGLLIIPIIIIAFLIAFFLENRFLKKK